MINLKILEGGDDVVVPVDFTERRVEKVQDALSLEADPKEVSGIFVYYVLRDGTAHFSWTGSFDYATMIGYLELMKTRIIKIARNED